MNRNNLMYLIVDFAFSSDILHLMKNYLGKRTLAVTSVLFFLCSVIGNATIAENSNVKLDVSFTTQASFPMSDLLNLIPGPGENSTKKIEDYLTSLQNNAIRITNKTTGNIRVKLRIQAQLSGYSSDWLADIKTNSYISLAAGATEVIDSKPKIEQYNAQNYSNINQSSLEDYVKRNFVNAGNAVLPSVTVLYRAELLDESGNSLSPAVVVQESISQPYETGQIALMSPYHNQIIGADSPPFFQWSPLKVRTYVDINYSIKIWKMELGEAVDSAKARRPVVDKSLMNMTSMVYPPDSDSLKPDTSYVWCVTAVDGLGKKIGLYSDVQQNYIFIVEPVPFVDIMQPYSDISGVPFDIRWSSVKGAYKYEVWIDKETSFGDPLKYIVDNTSVKVENMDFFEPGKTYYMKIRSLDANGNLWGKDFDRIPVKQFVFSQAIELRNPPDRMILNLLPPEFTWTPLSSVTNYQVDIAKDRGFSMEAKSLITPGSDSNLQNADYFFEPETQYFWRVKGLRSSRDWGKPSVIYSFSGPMLPLPTVVSPKDTALTSFFPEFNFTTVPWAEKYQVLVSMERGNWANAVVISTERSGVKYPSTEAAIKYAKQYFWKVIPINNAGKTYNKSSDIAGFTGPAVPPLTLVAPINDLLPSFEINFKWNPVEGAARYKLILAQDPGLNNHVFDVMTERTEQVFNNVPKRLDFDTTYYWGVQAYDSEGRNYGDQSVAANIKTPPKELAKIQGTDIVSPIDERLPVLAVSFRWLGISTATEYKLKIGRDSKLSDMPNFNHTVTGKNEATNEEIGLRLDQGVTYFWQVQAFKSHEKIGDASRIGKFSTPIYKVKLSGPLEVEVPETEVRFVWEPIAGAAKYRVIYSKDPTLVAGVRTGMSERPELVIDDLEKGKYYAWAVQALDRENSAYGQRSDIGRFSVARRIEQPPMIPTGNLGVSGNLNLPGGPTGNAKPSENVIAPIVFAGVDDINGFVDYLYSNSFIDVNYKEKMKIKSLKHNGSTNIPKSLLDLIMTGKLTISVSEKP